MKKDYRAVEYVLLNGYFRYLISSNFKFKGRPGQPGFPGVRGDRGFTGAEVNNSYNKIKIFSYFFLIRD